MLNISPVEWRMLVACKVKQLVVKRYAVNERNVVPKLVTLTTQRVRFLLLIGHGLGFVLKRN